MRNQNPAQFVVKSRSLLGHFLVEEEVLGLDVYGTFTVL